VPGRHYVVGQVFFMWITVLGGLDFIVKYCVWCESVFEG